MIKKGVGGGRPLFGVYKEIIKMKKILIPLVSLVILTNCGSEGGNNGPSDSFDREALLTHWADNIIIPAYTDLSDELALLTSATSTFVTTPNQTNMEDLRQHWLDAYLAWQWVEMFDIGKAEEITLRNYVNVYPLNEVDMEATLLSGTYDLSSVNRQDEQGFSAIDYLIYGVADTDENILGVYTDGVNGSLYKTYLSDVSERIETLVHEVLADWENGYRETFISRSGSSATESVNKLTNDFMYYYEKHLRAGKIGIPAGVFSETPLSDRVEARFSGELSKQLFMEALDATQNFFNGFAFGSSSSDGLGFDDYLESVDATKDDGALSVLINAQFESARTMANSLSDNLLSQVEVDNDLMLQTYDELQKNVVYLKVDMFQALNIQVDYVDADGD